MKAGTFISRLIWGDMGDWVDPEYRDLDLSPEQRALKYAQEKNRIATEDYLVNLLNKKNK